MTLDEAIAQLIELGEKDPLEIARKVGQRHDPAWISAELLGLAEDIIADIARRRLTAGRRASVALIRRGEGMDKAELGLRSLWVPDLLGEGVSGWKAVNECSPGDFEAVARSRLVLAAAVTRQADWFAELAARMRHEGAATYQEFRGELPVLPPRGELEAA